MIMAAITQIENIEAKIAKSSWKFTTGSWFEIFIFLVLVLVIILIRFPRKISFYIKNMHFKR